MILITKDYKLFSLLEQNRDVDLSGRRTRNLARSMMEYGWLDAFPLMAKHSGKKLVVIDGQHRLAIATEFGIPVKYVIETQDVDIAALQDTSHGWTIDDFVFKYAKAGTADYVELVAFHSKYDIPLHAAAGLMSNTASAGNAISRIKDGTWRITSRQKAITVAECRDALSRIHPVFKKSGALTSLWACIHVPYFEQRRLIKGAARQVSSIKSITKKDLFLELFEELYNFGRSDKRPLKFDAEFAMRARNAASRNGLPQKSPVSEA